MTIRKEQARSAMLSAFEWKYPLRSPVWCYSITPDQKVVWNYDAPSGHEVQTAVPIGKDHVLYIQNGDPAVIRAVDVVTNVTEREIALQVRHPSSTHGQFRHARLTDRGTLLVAHMDRDRVVEYDYNGNELWSFPGSGPWGVTPLTDNNVLITDKQGVREVTRRGDTVWSFNATEAANRCGTGHRASGRSAGNGISDSVNAV